MSEPDWLRGRSIAEEEAYYLEHYEENEYRYWDWCRINLLDPESVGSAVAYEEFYATELEARSNTSL